MCIIGDMITTAFINLGYNIIAGFISLFPSGGGFPTAWHTAIEALGGYLHILDPLVPISILLSCVLFLFTVEVAIFGFKTFRWIMGHVPLVGGKG